MFNSTAQLRAAPTGFRRLTPGLLEADRAAAGFDGLPDGVDVHGQLLAAFKAAAPRLGLSVRLVHALDWLFRFTRPQDWEEGARPVVWPSASMQQEALGLSESGVRSINRGLIDAGLISMKDSPNGKRYGMRDREGRIIEAYGLDLSPIATRYGEFVRLAAEAKAERKLIGRLRRRATIARKAIAQILETAAEYGFDGEEWSRLRHETRALIKSLRMVERPEEITIGVGSLERRQIEARRRLEQRLDAVNSAPMPAENCGHNIPTNQAVYPEKDTVMAHQGCGSPSGLLPSDPGPDARQSGKEEGKTRPGNESATVSATEGEPASEEDQMDTQQHITPPSQLNAYTAIHLSTDELTRLAPRLRTYLKSPRPAWPEIVDAADWLRGELSISQSLWGEACIAMGREQAAIAIAIVSAKPAVHFRSTPGGYFHGIVAKAKAGELNLARTVWGLRQAAASKPSCGSSRPGSCT
jgi:replication initiation protein RepC